MTKELKKLQKQNRVKHNSDWTSHVFFTCLAIVLVAFSLLIIGMLLWAFVTALKDEYDLIFDKNYLGLPNVSKYGWKSLWANFQKVFANFSFEIEESYYIGITGQYYQRNVTVTFWDMVLNSLIYSIGGSIFAVFVPATIAFLLAKYKFKFSKFVYGIALITYIIPIVGNYPSMLAVLRNLGLLDTWWGFFIMKFNFLGMYFFVFYSFFDNLSDSYIEAAELDGASQFQILFKVVFPLARKLILSVLLIVFVQMWNDFQTPYLYLHAHPTLAYGVWKMSYESINGVSSTNFRMASVMTMALPILLLFIFLKDRLMANMTLGGIKD